MRLIYQQDPATPLTHISLVVPRSGACLDPPALQGLSRLTLRLMLMGAGGRSHEVLSGQLERLGAATGFGLSNGHVTLRLSTLTANLDRALELFRLSLHEPNFDAAEFEQLRDEVVSAWVADREESKQLRAQEIFLQRSYGGGPPGYRADGQLAGLRDTPLDAVRGQYERLLSADGALCAVLSDLPRTEVESRILARLRLPAANGGGSAHGAYPWDDFEPTPAAGRRVTIVAEPGTNTDEVLLGGFSVAHTDADWHLHRLIAYTFGGDMNSRLFRIVRGERGLSYGASCWYEAAGGRAPRNRPGPFALYTFPSTEHTAEAVPLVLSLYEQLVADGLTEEELHLGRTALINSYPFRRDAPHKLLMLELDEALYGVVTDDDATHRGKLEAAGAAEVLATLRRTHHPQRLTIVLLGDPARLEPIASALPGVENVETIRYPETNGSEA